MPNPVQINNEIHRDLRINTARGAEFGENVHFVPVIADELRFAALEYPICLMKNSNTGQFGMHALLGFESGENLYLNGDRWAATYVPVHVRRQPFLVTYTAEKNSQPDPESAVISVDMDSARVQQEQGERIFDDDGNRTPFLDDMSKLLEEVIRGVYVTDVFVKVLAEMDLLESIQLGIMIDGEQRHYEGLYTVHEEKLAKMRGETLQTFHKKGYLQACHLVAASSENFRKLSDWKTRAS